jgi:hypothetical protein
MMGTRKRIGRGYKPYQPSPADIRRACEHIQATWSDRERAKRAGRLPLTSLWIPPSVDWTDLTDAANEDARNSRLSTGAPHSVWDG